MVFKVSTNFKVSLLQGNPELALEFDVELNGITPDMVSIAENKVRRYWRCRICTYTWQTTVSTRDYQGTGCPCCSGNKCVPHINSLAKSNPNLASEWHPTKNAKTPYDYLAGANFNAWWLCKTCSHDWKASINTRNSQGTGCPNCASFKRSSFPEMALYYYIQKVVPSVLSRGKINGVEVDVLIPDYRIAIEYDGLRFHKGYEFRDSKKNAKLSDHTFIRLREQGLTFIYSHGCINLEVEPRSKNLNNLITDVFSIMVSKGVPISYIPDINIVRDRIKIQSLYSAIVVKNSIADKRPDLVKFWDTTGKNGTLTPYNTYSNSSSKVYWVCKYNHSWEALVYSMTRETVSEDSLGCPVCSGRTTLEGFNDIKTTHPLIAKEFVRHIGGNRVITDFSAGSNELVEWCCSDCKNTFKCRVYTRTGKWAQDCSLCTRKFLVHSKLMQDGKLLGIRLIYGKRYADVSLDSLTINNIILDLSNVREDTLCLVDGKYVSDFEYKSHLHIDDYSDDPKFIKRLKMFLQNTGGVIKTLK